MFRQSVLEIFHSLHPQKILNASFSAFLVQSLFMLVKAIASCEAGIVASCEAGVGAICSGG